VPPLATPAPIVTIESVPLFFFRNNTPPKVLMLSSPRTKSVISGILFETLKRLIKICDMCTPFLKIGRLQLRRYYLGTSSRCVSIADLYLVPDKFFVVFFIRTFSYCCFTCLKWSFESINCVFIRVLCICSYCRFACFKRTFENKSGVCVRISCTCSYVLFSLLELGGIVFVLLPKYCRYSFLSRIMVIKGFWLLACCVSSHQSNRKSTIWVF
jgi:hypothetical protein